MVVQCPSCATKFRIADDKVTEKGVRVRCTSCKNVFQVKKSGIETAASQAQSGMTQELQALSFGPSGALIQKPATLPPKPASAPPAHSATIPPAPKSGAAPAARPAAITPPPSLRAAPGALSTASAPGAIGRRRPSAFSGEEGEAPPATSAGRARPSADDLFGMDELTGESSALPGSPLSSNPNLGKLPKPSSLPPAPPPPPIEAAPPPPPAPQDEPASDEPTDGSAPVKLGAIKTTRRDPFEGVDLASEGSGPISTEPEDGPGAKTMPPPAVPDPSLQRPVRREMVAVAMTGLLGIALALAVAAVAEFANFGPAWLRDAPENPLVATQIASGLYDASGPKPLFFVRGRIENRGLSTVSSIHVIADLMSAGGSVARAETVAGDEPTPEEVHALRTADEIEAMAQKLARAGADKKLAPGESAPFFALIADPPGDAERDELRIDVMPAEARK